MTNKNISELNAIIYSSSSSEKKAKELYEHIMNNEYDIETHTPPHNMITISTDNSYSQSKAFYLTPQSLLKLANALQQTHSKLRSISSISSTKIPGMWLGVQIDINQSDIGTFQQISGVQTSEPNYLSINGQEEDDYFN